jgi:uncharacterized membrane protein
LFTFFRILGFVLIVIILLLVGVGLFSSPETRFTLNENIESPVTVVWRTLLDTDHIPGWISNSTKVEVTHMSQLKLNAEITYFVPAANNEVIYKERLVNFIPDKRITFRDIHAGKIPLQKNYIRDYQLKSLLDGSTEINATIQYTCNGIIPRILDRLYLRAANMATFREQLKYIKRHIEKS